MPQGDPAFEGCPFSRWFFFSLGKLGFFFLSLTVRDALSRDEGKPVCSRIWIIMTTEFFFMRIFFLESCPLLSL